MQTTKTAYKKSFNQSTKLNLVVRNLFYSYSAWNVGNEVWDWRETDFRNPLFAQEVALVLFVTVVHCGLCCRSHGVLEKEKVRWWNSQRDYSTKSFFKDSLWRQFDMITSTTSRPSCTAFELHIALIAWLWFTTNSKLQIPSYLLPSKDTWSIN